MALAINLTVDAGSDYSIAWPLDEVPSGQALAQATLVATDPATGSAVISKTITSSELAGVGAITDTGISSGEAVFRFDLTPSDTGACSPGVRYPLEITRTSAAQKTHVYSRGVLVAR